MESPRVYSAGSNVFSLYTTPLNKIIVSHLDMRFYYYDNMIRYSDESQYVTNNKGKTHILYIFQVLRAFF